MSSASAAKDLGHESGLSIGRIGLDCACDHHGLEEAVRSRRTNGCSVDLSGFLIESMGWSGGATRCTGHYLLFVATLLDVAMLSRFFGWFFGPNLSKGSFVSVVNEP